jgi:hypothetical protein
MENKTSKYFKYAIGEIVLVVIGILIALQINNWNENRIIIKNQEKYLMLLKKEVQNNIEQLEKANKRVKGMWEAQKELINLIESNRDTITEKYVNSMLNRAFGPKTYVELEKSVISELKTTGELKNINNDSIRKKIVALEPIANMTKEQEILVINECDLGRAIIREDGYFFVKLSSHNSIRNLDILNNPIFVNTLLMYTSETTNLIEKQYPRLKKHLTEFTKMIDTELLYFKD